MISPDNIAPEALYLLTAIFLVLMAIIVLITGIYLRMRRRHFFIQQNVAAVFDHWLEQMLLNDQFNVNSIDIPSTLTNKRRNKVARQYVIEQLINTKRNLVGIASRNLLELYKKLELKKDTLSKFHHPVWHQKARGISELYMMEQKDLQDAIFKHTNSRNEYVRMEAQAAILAFDGFDGLRFLNTLTESLSNWQQIKLLEQLRPLDPGSFEHLSAWLQSPNKDVVIFALKLADIYQQMQVKTEVIDCLQNTDETIRAQAIHTLCRVGDEFTPGVLVRQYYAETELNRKVILISLEHIATEEELPFLLEVYEMDDPAIKLQAAKAIANCSPGGLQLLQQKALQIPDPYEKIFLHVKSVQLR